MVTVNTVFCKPLLKSSKIIIIYYVNVNHCNSLEKCSNIDAKALTMGPLHTIGASFSTRNPIDIHLTP